MYNGQPSGVLFRNDRKTTENQPDYTGNAEFYDGKEYYVSMWTKTSKKGMPFFSLSFTPKEQSGAVQKEEATAPPASTEEFAPF